MESKSEMLLESVGKCSIGIPLWILFILDQKILKIVPEMAEVALCLCVLFNHLYYSSSPEPKPIFFSEISGSGLFSGTF